MAEQQAVIFRLGEESYGVDIATVREIITRPEITPVPESPEYTEGIINLRGHVVPVMNLRRRMGLDGQTGGTTQDRIIILESGDTTVGCIVDSVDEVLRIDETAPGLWKKPSPAWAAFGKACRRLRRRSGCLGDWDNRSVRLQR